LGLETRCDGDCLQLSRPAVGPIDRITPRPVYKLVKAWC